MNRSIASELSEKARKVGQFGSRAYPAKYDFLSLPTFNVAPRAYVGEPNCPNGRGIA